MIIIIPAVSQHLSANKGSINLLMEAPPVLELPSEPSAKISVIRTKNASSRPFCSLVFRWWCVWPWTGVLCTCGRVGDRLICHWGHILCCALTKLSLGVMSHYYFLFRSLFLSEAFNTFLSFFFPLSLSRRKLSLYEHNKKYQTTHKDLSTKNGVKRGKKNSFMFIFFMVEFFWQAVFYVGVLCLCQHKRPYLRLQREVKVNGFPTDKISHFCLLV